LRGRSVGEHRRGVLSQRLQTRVRSQLLDSLLGMNLGLDTDSVFREGGDAYLHVVRPGLSGRIQELAQLKLQYEYALDKPSPLAPEHARNGYQLSVDGALQDGALTWGGRFSSRERFDHNAVRTRATDTLDLKSRFQLARSLHVELTGALRNETRFSRAGQQAITETRYGAALGWSPSERYALGLKVDALDREAEPESAVLGSGSISWFPRPDLELKLDYGDRLVDGEPGWVLHTRFDLSG
jgi:uncharacterized protein (PEP-CTERM system associated)